MKLDTSIINQALLKTLFEYNDKTGLFIRRVSYGPAKAGTSPGAMNSGGYIQISIGRRLYLAHRLAWMYVYGEWPTGTVDHINRNPLDNRLENLRIVTHSENCQNASMYQNNTSGRRGVSWRKDCCKWAAYIRHENKQYHLGYFDDVDEAGRAHVEAAKRLHRYNPTAQ